MIATISADIVNSSSLSSNDMLLLRNGLYSLFEKFEKDYTGFWGRIIRGDGIECFVPEYKYSLRIALLMKLFVKIQAGRVNSGYMLRGHGIRFSIGIADINYVNKQDDMINGPAISISGRNLEKISSNDYIYTAFEADRIPRSYSNLLDSYVAMLGNLVDSYSAKQSEVVYYKLLGFREVEISERLGIYQSSVNMRSSSAKWGLLNTAIKDFEKLEF